LAIQDFKQRITEEISHQIAIAERNFDSEEVKKALHVIFTLACILNNEKDCQTGKDVLEYRNKRSEFQRQLKDFCWFRQSNKMRVAELKNFVNGEFL